MNAVNHAAPPPSSDPYVAAAQQRILTAANQPICACGHTHEGGQPCRLTGCSCAAFHRSSPTATGGILTAAEKRAVPPAGRLVLLGNSLANLHRAPHLSIADRQLAQLLLDLVDVVEQLAGQVTR